MTNREYLESLSDKDLATAIYTVVILEGKAYTDSIGGIEQWLKQEREEVKHGRSN